MCGQEQVVEPGARRRGEGRLGGEGTTKLGEDAEVGVGVPWPQVRMPKTRSAEMQ